VPTRFVLDYFHVSMKLRHIDQCIGAIPLIVLSPDGSVFELYDRFNYLRGYLWSGRRAKFQESVDRLLELLDRAPDILPDLHRSIHMATGHLCDLAWSIRKTESGVINYGRWRREGRRISTSAVEGTVNRLIGRRLGKGQHMCWTKRGAHLLLQVRCAVLNGELLERFQRWFPGVGTRQVGLPCPSEPSNLARRSFRCCLCRPGHGGLLDGELLHSALHSIALAIGLLRVNRVVVGRSRLKPFDAHAKNCGGMGRV
jgi:hypothetical protein